ncbi:hypothetical protein FHR83_005753 [Actinoplanes campanulatus]|uniref:Cholesterol esterase n=1 Tax=Actinoplanes campanulatus TaxID=113559 RepID=A0A7W5AKR2_9ACTN|nr:DUF6230 family protein [Actinoplanes campanulatus]MBB3098068.1 hypothetical protein [Actinoplanes campanulatus]GGN32196.1 cholesterol esterase [Actinoplanes campanulatus]GID40061.1 cholesterol esterase [Actinoplanes campanulatus]
MSSTYGRTRWRRFTAMLLGGLAGAAGLILLTGEGVLAASFSISGMPFTVTSPKLHGYGFAQYAEIDNMAPGSPNEGDTGGQVLVIVSAIRDAELDGLCQSIALGGINLKITAGSPTDKVTADTLVVDSDVITANATFKTIDIGQDASTLDRVPGRKGAIGVFGQQAEEVTLTNLRQNNYATTAATFYLPNLRMAFTSDGC